MTTKQQHRFFRSIFDRLQREANRLENYSPASRNPLDFSDVEEIHRNLATAVEYARAIVARLEHEPR